jgi:hypothetical protein
MKCLLKYTFHEVMALWELKSHLEYVKTACDNTWPVSEFEAAPLSIPDNPSTGVPDPSKISVVVPLSFQQTGSSAKIVKARGECSVDNVLDNDADARLFFEGAMPWSVTAEDVTASMIAVTDAGGVMLKEASAMMASRMNEQISEGMVPEADGALVMDKLSMVFESKMGSCSEGHECSEAELAATSVPPPAAINALVNMIGGPGGVMVNTVEASLDTAAFGSSECLVMCASYDFDGQAGTCEAVDYEKLGKDVKAFQTKQFQLSSFLYAVGGEMVYEEICSMDLMHRQLRGRSLRKSTTMRGRQLGGVDAAPATCDGVSKLEMFSPCGENVTVNATLSLFAISECCEGECTEGVCLPTHDDSGCSSIMEEFGSAADNCSTLVVIDGLAEGFNCLHKYVDDLYGDCVHVPDPDMEECGHILVIGKEIIHAFEHSIEALKTHPDLLVEKFMAKMAEDKGAFAKMQERILELAMPIWMSDQEDTVDSVLEGLDDNVIMDMCDPLLSFGRATNINWDQDCTLFESIMCLATDESNVTQMSTDRGEAAMYCARAYMAFYPHDDGLFQTCLKESASNAGGPYACVENELDPLIAGYLESGSDTLEGVTIKSPTGADQTHNLEDAMYAATMAPAEVIDANVEMATYVNLRRLNEKKRQRRLQAGEADCLTVNGKKYCSKDADPQNMAPLEAKVPASNGKMTHAHKFFTRKHKARKLHRAHKHLMRKHRQQSRK